MAREVWKSYEDNALTHSAAHYLMTIHELLATQGYARVTDIAKRLNITRGSCSISLKPLQRRGLVVEKNDELLEGFFRDVLGVSAEQSEVDACKIEHLLSIECSVKLAAFIRVIRSDHKAVKDFTKLLRKETATCSQGSERCPTCQEECFYELQGREAEATDKKA